MSAIIVVNNWLPLVLLGFTYPDAMEYRAPISSHVGATFSVISNGVCNPNLSTATDDKALPHKSFEKAEKIVTKPKITGVATHLKKRQKSFKALEEAAIYTIDSGVNLDRIELLSHRGVVGRIEGTKKSQDELVEWVNVHWTPIFCLSPCTSLLSRGWVAFIFPNEELIQLILEQTWLIKEDSLVLKRWHINFNPLTEQMRIRHLWVLLSEFPFELWMPNVFEGLGNLLGRFIRLEKNLIFGINKKMASMLVEFDVTKGLSATVDIYWRDKVYKQILDYKNIHR